ncbi:type II secretion system protein [Novispirillum sp. DQ9]|uniref:type II secretion system protein n=1 Tax=Novispirillum sp. DQ9 TaxID=3398612 RepID=UPI003C7C9F22
MTFFGRRPTSRGFTLIELAIVVAIVGLMTGAGMFGLNALRENARQKETATALRDVDYALTLFVIRHGRLPWADTDQDGAENANAPEGTLPYVALGVARGDVVDGWGNFLRYAVDPVFVNVGSGELTCARDPGTLQGNFQGTGALNLQDLTGGATSLAYVLVSHGENGLGATNANGGANAAAASVNEIENTDGDTDFRAEGQAADGAFDDISSGRGAGQILRDTGCRQVSDLTGTTPPPDDPPAGGESDTNGPNLPGQVDFTNSRMEQRHADGAYEGFAATTNWDQRTTAPRVDTSGAEAIVAFDSTHEPNGNSEVRSCFWGHYAVPLTNGTLRAFFEASFTEDTADSKAGGLVFALLPWELKTREPYGYNSAKRCGFEGPYYLGFSPISHGNDRDLYKTNEFTGNPAFEQVMPIGLELDVSRSNGKDQGRDFYDPALSGTAQQNHMATLVDNGFHNGTAAAHSYPNDRCNGTDEGCAFNGSAAIAVERNWLERGPSVWHKVRLEVEDEADACGAGQVEIRGWVWPSGTDCAGDCGDLSVDYDPADPESGGTYFARRCQDKPTRTVSMGYGWTPISWAMMRVGFTTGAPNAASARSMPRIRSFIAGGAPKWAPRSDAASGAVSQEIHNNLLGPNVGSGVNWTRLTAAGANPSNGWTGVTWLSLPTKGADILSYNGEITITPDLNELKGIGVKGIGGATNEWHVPPLDNSPTPGEPGTEEGLSVHLDQRYDAARLWLVGLENGEMARVTTYQAADYTKRKVYEVSGCGAAHGGVVTLEPGIKVDSVYVEALPRSNGTGSSLWVRSARLCNDLNTCTMTYGWASSPCTLSAVEVEE